MGNGRRALGGDAAEEGSGDADRLRAGHQETTPMAVHMMKVLLNTIAALTLCSVIALVVIA